MSSSPPLPRIFKGALVSFDSTLKNPQVIKFQYNPETLNRSVRAQTQGDGNAGDPAEDFRFKGAAIETISLDIEFDATDQLEHPEQNNTTVTLGIHPQLAALELLLYPNSAIIIENANSVDKGIMEIVGPEGPFIVFIWGPKRILPVRLTEFQINEQEYDINLNPIRAKVSINLRVLTYDDFSRTHPGWNLFLNYQQMKESMSSLISGNDLSNTSIKKIF